MKFEKIQRVPNGEDTVRIGGISYVVRFSAKHAEHIKVNYDEAAHRISYGEIVNLLKNSIVLPPKGRKWVALGRFGKKIYETYFYLIKDRLDVITSFKCNKPNYIQDFKQYESD